MGPIALALAAALFAQDLEVRWRGDPRCPEADFQGSLARYLAGASERRAVEVSAEVRREGEAGWSATLVLTTAEGRSTRALRGRSCAEVSDAAAFVTAVVVDPGVLTRPEPGAIVPAPEGVELPQEAEADGEAATVEAGQSREMSPGTGEADPLGDPAPSQQEARAVEPPGPLTGAGSADMSPEPEPEPGLRGFVRVTGGLEALGMPRVGPTVGLAGGLLIRRRGRVELTGLYRAPTTQYTAIDPSAGARVRMWAVGARGCWVPEARRVEVPLCGGLEVGQALGEGVGYAGARSDRFVWAAALLGPALAWAPRPWLALWLGADLAVPLRRGSFGAAGLGTIFAIAPVSLRAALGLEFRLGRGNPR